jgi:hypothetical protein
MSGARATLARSIQISFTIAAARVSLRESVLKFIRFTVLVVLAASCTTAVFSQSPIPTGPLKVRLQPVVSGLSGTLTGNTANSRRQFIPIDMSPLGDGRQLVFTLGGHVRLLQANGTLAAGAYLDTFNNVSSPLPGDLNFRDIGNTWQVLYAHGRAARHLSIRL